MGTVVAALVVLALVVLAVRSLVRTKKSGKSISCGGDCKNCGGHCEK